MRLIAMLTLLRSPALITRPSTRGSYLRTMNSDDEERRSNCHGRNTNRHGDRPRGRVDRTDGGEGEDLTIESVTINGVDYNSIPNHEWSSKRYYVYVLSCQSRGVFYIGKGTKNRIYEHEKGAKGTCNLIKYRTIREIWSDGDTILRQVFFLTDSDSEALRIEKDFIAHFYEQGGLINQKLPHLWPKYNQSKSTA